MLFAIAIILLVGLLFLPQLWTRHIFKRYSQTINELPGTGGELANHLVERLQLNGVKVEVTDPDSDHYDPRQRTIGLSPDVYDGKSLTAVVVSAHEVGHALQHKLGYKPLYLRWQLARFVASSEKIASMLLIAMPFIVMLTRLPALGGIMLIVGLGILSMPVMFHLITLPVELDASFNRALPILRQGGYIPESAMPIANRILMAAAFTYVSASLASVLNFYRWIAILRR